MSLKSAKKLNEKTCCHAKAVTWDVIKPKLLCLLIFLATKKFIIFASHDELCHNLVILKIKIFLRKKKKKEKT